MTKVFQAPGARLQPWLVAFNRPTGTWSSGGSRQDYPAEHNDVFLVLATDRGHAETLGRERRRAVMRLTDKQRLLLHALLDEVRDGPGDAERRSIEIHADEATPARRLAECGLLRFSSNDDRHREVFLSAEAFNPSVAPAAKRRAMARENRLERRLPPPSAAGGAVRGRTPRL